MVTDRASIWHLVVYIQTRIFRTLIWVAAAESSKSISYANGCHLGAVVWYPQTRDKPLASDRKRRKRQSFPETFWIWLLRIGWKWSNCGFQEVKAHSLTLAEGIHWFCLDLKDAFESKTYDICQEQVKYAELSLTFFLFFFFCGTKKKLFWKKKKKKKTLKYASVCRSSRSSVWTVAFFKISFVCFSYGVVL